MLPDWYTTDRCYKAGIIGMINAAGPSSTADGVNVMTRPMNWLVTNHPFLRKSGAIYVGRGVNENY